MKIVLTTHGKFASGILDSYKMIFGSSENILTVELTEEGIGNYRKELRKILDEVINKHDILILSDLKGGTPHNESYQYFLENIDNVSLVSGLNLSMLIEVGATSLITSSLNELTMTALKSGKDGIDSVVNDEIITEENNQNIF